MEKQTRSQSTEDLFIENFLFPTIVQNWTFRQEIDVLDLMINFVRSTHPKKDPYIHHILNNLQCRLRREATVLQLSENESFVLDSATRLVSQFLLTVQPANTDIVEAKFATTQAP